jgi:hypothetical protein
MLLIRLRESELKAGRRGRLRERRAGCDDPRRGRHTTSRNGDAFDEDDRAQPKA